MLRSSVFLICGEISQLGDSFFPKKKKEKEKRKLEFFFIFRGFLSPIYEFKKIELIISLGGRCLVCMYLGVVVSTLIILFF